ncbi:MAG TPA: NUDIX domain-containing protein [Pseudorhodoplanes sp.]|nr:NUDIX domain-containing protein [Pseudorhodoplanes sp.]
MARRRLGGRRKDVSAGLLVWRNRAEPEFLLAHPGGPYWAKKDEGAWTIPKGLVDPGDGLLPTARREFFEETGLEVDGLPTPLAPVVQSSGKTVHGFALEADLDLGRFRSVQFEMEWPPHSGRKAQFPEIDRIAYFTYEQALRKIIGYQRPFIEELKRKLGRS